MCFETILQRRRLALVKRKEVFITSCLYRCLGLFFYSFCLGSQILSFIDDCTRVSWVYLLKSKHDVLHVIPQFSKMVITQFNMQVKVFHSDNGPEFANRSLATLFQENGILHQTTCVYTPQ